MSSSSSAASSAPLSYVDIGANLLDDRFTKGIYHGKSRHEPDIDAVLSRAHIAGVKHLVLTAGTLQESKEAVETVRRLRQDKTINAKLYCTVGVHPTRCNEFNDGGRDPNKRLQELIAVALDGCKDGVVCAVGEMGLDYDRLQFCPKQTQLDYFKLQLQLAQMTQLPMFLHNRNVNDDLYNLLKENRDMWRTGTVHTFDDSAELAAKFMDLGLFIGLNGCSLKTEENLRVIKTLPLDRILLETDCPYCEIRKTHAGYSHIKTFLEAKPEKKFVPGFAVKGRNEPANIVQVAEVVAGVKGITVREVAQACYENSLKLYGWKE